MNRLRAYWNGLSFDRQLALAFSAGFLMSAAWSGFIVGLFQQIF